jgi:hypothetical protein
LKIVSIASPYRAAMLRLGKLSSRIYDSKSQIDHALLNALRKIIQKIRPRAGEFFRKFSSFDPHCENVRREACQLHLLGAF